MPQKRSTEEDRVPWPEPCFHHKFAHVLDDVHAAPVVGPKPESEPPLPPAAVLHNDEDASRVHQVREELLGGSLRGGSVSPLAAYQN